MKTIAGKVLRFSYFFSCFFIMLNCYAHAYVDATSVTYVIQAVVGLFVAIGAVFTVQRHKIVAAWRKWYYGRLAKKNAKEQLDKINAEEKSE